jgi:TIR domain
MRKIFISYRRFDEVAAGALGRDLRQLFGDRQIFRDKEDIGGGVSWRKEVLRAISRDSALLVLIGKDWANATDKHGTRRLDNSNDPLRLEITAALKAEAFIIPILLQNAEMPGEEELPSELRALAEINALNLRDGDWLNDVEKIRRTLTKAGFEPVGSPSEKVREPIQTEWQVADTKPAEHVIRDKTTDVPSAATPSNGSRTYQKPGPAKVFVKARKGLFGVWIDPQKWEDNSSSEDPIKITLNHKTGDAYAFVISERIGISIESLKKAAVENAQKVAPDVKVVSEEKRIVNGKEVLCLQTTGTIQGTPFTYYGYYYGGPEGTLQVVTYTASNIFDEYKQDFDDFLNGTQIGP